jgi:hypothetical protein
MKKTIKDLTPEIKEKISQYKKDCVQNLYNGLENKKLEEKRHR